jgi:hypothetical protein
MEEKEYLLSKSVRPKDDVLVDKNDVKCNVDAEDDADDESGVFCSSNDFQKTDPEISLSYWMGQLLTEQIVSGKKSLTLSKLDRSIIFYQQQSIHRNSRQWSKLKPVSKLDRFVM